MKGYSPVKTIEERLISKIVKSPNGCWLWAGAKDRHGHGQVWHGVGPVSAHRVAYEVWVGPIPEGYAVMRTCRQVLCVNPEHLTLKQRKSERVAS
jgi:hypothetical protein